MNEVSIPVSYIFGINKTLYRERKLGSKSEKERGQVEGPTRNQRSRTNSQLTDR